MRNMILLGDLIPRFTHYSNAYIPTSSLEKLLSYLRITPKT